MTFSQAARAAGSSPEARKKAAATLRKTVAARKAAAAAEKAGTLTTFNVADLNLPKKKQPKAKKGARRSFTPSEKLAYVKRIEAAIDNGTEVQKALDNAGIHGSQFYSWQRNAKKLAKKAAKMGAKPNGKHPAAELRRIAASKTRKGPTRVLEHMNGAQVHSFYDQDAQSLKVCLHIAGNDVLVTTEEALGIRAGLAAMGF